MDVQGMYLASSTPPLLTLSLVMPSLHLLELTKKNFVCQVGLNILLNRDILYPSLIILLIFLAPVYLSHLPSFGSMPRNDVVEVQDDDNSPFPPQASTKVVSSRACMWFCKILFYTIDCTVNRVEFKIEGGIGGGIEESAGDDLIDGVGCLTFPPLVSFVSVALGLHYVFLAFRFVW
jgi:hypothetical protein